MLRRERDGACVGSAVSMSRRRVSRNSAKFCSVSAQRIRSQQALFAQRRADSASRNSIFSKPEQQTLNVASVSAMRCGLRFVSAASSDNEATCVSFSANACVKQRFFRLVQRRRLLLAARNAFQRNRLRINLETLTTTAPYFEIDLSGFVEF